MFRQIYKLLEQNPWHFLWIGVILSEVFTLTISAAQSYLYWGHFPRQVFIVGVGDAFLVSLIVVALTINFVSQVTKLKQELATRKEAEQQIRFLAYYDSLTSLPNRFFFKELLEHAISYADRHDLVMAVLFIDLDYFKRINDTLGHDKGDKLLRSVTNRLLRSIRSSDYVARWDDDAGEVTDFMSRLGGDEFIFLLHDLTRPEDAATVANRILSDIAEPFDLDGREVFITASIGVSLYPADGRDVDELLKNADVAMYHAKSKGRNNCQFYSKSMTSGAVEFLNLKNKLHRALEHKEFLVHYQPRLSLSEKKLIGLEALLRWKPHDGDIVLPSEYIALTEETGLIIPIGEWVLREACRQGKAWQEEGNIPLVVSVNLSNRQFDQDDLIEVVKSALNDAALEARYLELEITESAIMHDPEEAIATLHQLKGMGVKISIDDFGTGYSSLNYLRRIPLDYLKIDRSFVNNIGTSYSDEAIIKTVIALAHSLRLRVVAEGVETDRQVDFLKDCGCDEVQGFLFSPPMSADEISRFSASQSAPARLDIPSQA